MELPSALCSSKGSHVPGNISADLTLSEYSVIAVYWQVEGPAFTIKAVRHWATTGSPSLSPWGLLLRKRGPNGWSSHVNYVNIINTSTRAPSHTHTKLMNALGRSVRIGSIQEDTTGLPGNLTSDGPSWFSSYNSETRVVTLCMLSCEEFPNSYIWSNQCMES